jgi:AMMECR1 domain-containing protein
LLLALARESIAHGLAYGRALAVDPTDYAPELQAQRAAFVTLHEHGQLRGCIGHLEAVQPLVRDVVENAFAAAFRKNKSTKKNCKAETEIEKHNEKKI